MAKKKKHNLKQRRDAEQQGNPLYTKQNAFLETLSDTERTELFNPSIGSDRRAELWMEQAELGEDLVNRYAWATPSSDALKIVKEFSPIVEIGCGANAYWASRMKQAGIDVIAYDMYVETGGKINPSSKKHEQKPSMIRKGGPSNLKQHGDRTLFLCYPDEEGEGMGAECLEHYDGTHVIHVGETFLDANLASDQAPYGRSSSSEFQERLASEFHCVLKVELPNWLHVRDSISVWKRSETSTMVFAADSDDEEQEDEEIEYRHIPCDERLPMSVAAACCAHLLPQATTMGRKSAFDQVAMQRSRSNSGDSLSSKRMAKPSQKPKPAEDSVDCPARSCSDSTESAGRRKRDRSDSTDSKKKRRERSDSTDSKKKRRERADSTDSNKKKRERSDSTDSKGMRKGNRERSDSTDSAKKRKKLKKAHQQSVDSLFGGLDADEASQLSPSRNSFGKYVTPW